MVLTEVYQQRVSSKWVKKWSCSNCNCTDLDSVGFIQPEGIEHMIGREKVCPQCHSMGKDDYKNSIEMRIEVLTESKNKTEIEIDKLIRELDEIKQKENV